MARSCRCSISFDAKVSSLLKQNVTSIKHTANDFLFRLSTTARTDMIRWHFSSRCVALSQNNTKNTFSGTEKERERQWMSDWMSIKSRTFYPVASLDLRHCSTSPHFPALRNGSSFLSFSSLCFPFYSILCRFDSKSSAFFSVSFSAFIVSSLCLHIIAIAKFGQHIFLKRNIFPFSNTLIDLPCFIDIHSWLLFM